MATDTVSGGPLTRLYSNRIGRPDTTDEATGYWIFALGVVLGIVGIAWLVVSDLRQVPQAPVIVAAAALVLLIAGPLIRLPLRRLATILVYVGALLSLVAIPWFAVSYPGWRGEAPGIIGLYALGMAVMALGGVFVPVLTSGTERGREIERQRERIADLQSALEDADADEADLTRLIDELRDSERNLAELLDEAESARADSEVARQEAEATTADTAADEADLAAQLRTLRESQARFELFADSADEWRWRLRHRNGNTIADSGEGYTRKHNAQKGIQSVRRNSLGAGLMLVEADEEPPEEDEEFEPPEEVESRAEFEVYEDKGGEHRWRLRHDNGSVIADGSEGYATRGSVNRAVRQVREYVGPATYLRFDPTGFEVYRDAGGEWRWRLVHRNGNILADSGEGYSRSNDARRAADRIRERVDDMEFEVFEDNAGEHRWRLLGGNDQIVGDSGEGYSSRSEAEEAVDRVRDYAPDADLLEIGRAAFEIYEDSAGEYRWRLRHRNGNIISDSGQGYSDRSGARDGIESVKRNLPNAEVAEE
jgi:uncharacterized protein YegP (UPF0339 family)